MKHLLEFQNFDLVKEFSLLDGSEGFTEITESEFLALFSESLFESAPKGNTVTGGLFDMNDANTYKWVKNAKSAVVNGTKHVFISIGDGIKEAGQKAKEAGKAGAEQLLNMAKFVGKTIVYTGAAIYVISDMIAQGIYSLLASLYSVLKKGAIAVGAGIGTAVKNIKNMYKAQAKASIQAYQTAGDAITKFLKSIMSGLYAAAKATSNAASAIAAVTVAGWKTAKKYFGEVKDFISKCLFDAAKETKAWVADKAKDAKDAYNAAVKSLKDKKTQIAAAIKKGYEDYKKTVISTANKGAQYGRKLKGEVSQAFKTAQDRISKTGDEIVSQAKAVWGGLFDSNNFYGEGLEDIFESYVIVEGEEYYIFPY